MWCKEVPWWCEYCNLREKASTFFFFPQCNGRNLWEKLLLYFSVFPEVQWWEFEGESSNLFFYRSAAVGIMKLGYVLAGIVDIYSNFNVCNPSLRITGRTSRSSGVLSISVCYHIKLPC